MNEFEDLQNCQAWEQCAEQYYYHEHRNLFVDKEGDSRGYADDATWILTSSFVIFTMQSGFGLLEAGSCSPGFEVNIMMKNIVDVVFTALSYYLVGYGISFGTPATPFMGMGQMPADGGYGEVSSGLLYSQYIFQLSFAATSTTIVSGCVAMRLKFFIYLLYSLISVIFYSFVAHWIFSDEGWLNQMGVHDFAGGAPVHIFGGVNGLIATLFLGPRLGRFDGSRPLSDFFPSSVSSQCLGMLTLWWGWIGFNCGSSFGITDSRWVVAIRCSITTINATIGGGIMSIIYTLWRTGGRLVIPEHTINGILGSLVAITPSCASVHTYDAIAIGAVGALVGLGVNTVVCHCQVDDPVGAIGVHFGSAVWGMISVGLFADSNLIGIDVMDGLFRGGGFKLLGLQLLAVAATSGWALLWSTGFFYIVGVCISRDWKNPRKGLRVDPKEEERGADWYLHGVIDQEAYLADMEKEEARTGEDDSFSSDGDDTFYENGPGGRKQELINKSDMYMRSIFNGHWDDLKVASLDDSEDGHQSFQDAKEIFAEEDEGSTDKTEGEDGHDDNLVQIEKKDEHDTMMMKIEEGDEEVHDEVARAELELNVRRPQRTRARGGLESSFSSQVPNNTRTMMLRTRTAKRGLGLNGGLGHAIISPSVLNEMDEEQMRRARRAPRNVGLVGQISQRSFRETEVPDRRSMMMDSARAATGERHLKIYR